MRLPRFHFYSRIAAFCAVAIMLALFSNASAQSINTLEDRQNVSVEQYRRLSREIALSTQRQQELEAEIAAIKDDSAALTAALIQAAKTERKLSEDIVRIEERLDELGIQEAGLRRSLSSRRSVLAEVLAALQRMGLNPPPAILVRPEDALASVRSAILLGSVVPELREETDALVADLQDLSKVAESIRSEQGRLWAKETEQVEEKERLSLLLEEKQRLQAEAEVTIENERKQAEQLATEAKSLQDLIASLEGEIESLRKAAETAKADGEAGKSLDETLAFSKRKGLVPLPVSGTFGSRFGDDDGIGSPLKGDILRTQSGAIVTALVDATVLYAGPFRSYGQLLILNPGDGYHIVLTGMDRLNVAFGQSVLAGEPVGVMGEARLASIAVSSFDGTMPELYVEFRKDGKPVDPKPWWTRDIAGRTENDS
jgi:septal ring factor EnvC (AmiA/AmiB activator)